MSPLRQQIADLLKADPREVVFTSGATESNNIAIKGVARFYKAKRNHVITTQTVCTHTGPNSHTPTHSYLSLNTNNDYFITRNTNVCWIHAEL